MCTNSYNPLPLLEHTFHSYTGETSSSTHFSLFSVFRPDE